MEKVSFGAIPRDVKTKAEQFFGMSLDHVTLAVSQRPRQLGARAFAFGNTLHLLPEATDFSKPENRALLGHELTHIAQQRQGQVVAHTTLAGMPFVDDAQLEAQAWRLGWRFANDQTCDVSFQPNQMDHRPVLQRAVLVDGKMIDGLDDLNTEPATVIQLIEGGSDWLNWASKDMNVRYEFENQLLLTEGVQLGLHGSSLLLMNKLGLWVNPLKLLTLEPRDFNAITDYELGLGNPRGAKMFAVNALRANDLFRQTDLAKVDALLDDWKVSAQPVFQALGLADSIALFQLGQWVETQEFENGRAQRIAADFAVGVAQSPQEFIDYFQYFVTLAQKQGWNDEDNVPNNQQFARSLIAQMLPILARMLRGAILEYRPTTQALQEFVQAWQGMGMPLGFQRISAAINQVTQHTTVGDPNQPLTPAIEEYLQAAQAFISDYEAQSITLSQDGVRSSYAIENGSDQAQLNWNVAGVLTMETFSADPAGSKPVPESSGSTTTKGATNGNEKRNAQSQKTNKKANPKTSKKEGKDGS